MYDKYETFILAEDLPDKSVLKGTRGVVLVVLDITPYTYEVEFADGEGGNLGNEITYTSSKKSVGSFQFRKSPHRVV